MITPEQLASSGTEHGHQAALFCWRAQNIDKYPELKWMYAIPQGELRDKKTAGKLKAEGVKKGVVDILLLVRRGEYSCLWIELKKPKGKGATDEQLEFIEQARQCGQASVVCIGWEKARDIIIWYLNYGNMEIDDDA